MTSQSEDQVEKVLDFPIEKGEELTAQDVEEIKEIDVEETEDMDLSDVVCGHDEPDEPVPVEDNPKSRAEACNAEINKVLQSHRCVIQPFLNQPKSVGDSGDEAIISCSYGIRAIPL